MGVGGSTVARWISGQKMNLRPHDVRWVCEKVRDLSIARTKRSRTSAFFTTTADMNQPTIEQTVDLAQKYGYIKDKPDLGELIRPAGGQ